MSHLCCVVRVPMGWVGLRGDRGINVRGIGIANDPWNAEDVTDSTAGVVAERPISKTDCQEKQT
jgi:hypothetical protein